MRRIAVCIPSFGRAGAVKTLRFCQTARLYVDEGEAEAYRTRHQGADLAVCPRGIHGNIGRVRNYILKEEFSRGASAVCMMDDDISRIFVYRVGADGFGYVRDRLEGEDFLGFIEKYTALAEELGCSFWGMNIMPANRLYKHGTPFSFEKPVLGPFCVHLSARFQYDESLSPKEDYDIFLQHLEAERKVLRLNFACYENGGSGLKRGGCSFERNAAKERRLFMALQRKWGGAIVQHESRNGRKAFDINPIIKNPIKGA